MTDIITVPAGVIMPKDLLMWLRKQRDSDLEIAEEYEIQGDSELAESHRASAAAYNHVIQHISYGGTP